MYVPGMFEEKKDNQMKRIFQERKNKSMKVKCISIREKMPEQIKLDEVYFIRPESIWDDREDWYCEVYKDKGFKEKVGNLKLSHFTRVE